MSRMNVSRGLTVFIVISIICATAYGAEHKKEEVEQIIKETEAKLSTVKNGGDADLVKNEIANIERHIAESRKLLSKRDIDLAFNEISLAMLYFPMLEARIDLQKATNELNEAKDKYSK